MSTTSIVNQDVVDAFARDGVVCLRSAFEPRWIELLAAGIERNRTEPGPFFLVYTQPDAPGRFWDDYCNWDRIPEYREFVFGSPAAEIAGRLTGSTMIRLFHEHVLVKEPGTTDVTPWHHDLPYYCVDGRQLCSIWMPLDPVPSSIGVQFVAGSHNWGRMFSPARFGQAEARDYAQMGFEPLPDIDADPDRYKILSWSLEPGDCLVFHMLTLHGAPGNVQAETRRRGFATRWLGDDAVYAVRQGTKTSPPFPGLQDALQPGQPLDHPLFPVVWRA